MASNTPAATHSSRRSRAVVSDTTRPVRRSASSQLQPVASLTSITLKQARSEARGRWHPNGWGSKRFGSVGSTAAQMASPTSGSSARMMVGTSTWSSVLGAPDSTVGTRQRPVDGHLDSKEEVPVQSITRLSARPVSAGICSRLVSTLKIHVRQLPHPHFHPPWRVRANRRGGEVHDLANTLRILGQAIGWGTLIVFGTSTMVALGFALVHVMNFWSSPG